MSGFHFSLLPHYVGGSTKQARDRTNLGQNKSGCRRGGRGPCWEERGSSSKLLFVELPGVFTSSSHQHLFPRRSHLCGGFCSNPNSEEQESGSEFRNVQEHDRGIVTPFSVMLENQNQAAQKLERDQEWRLGCWVLWIEVCLEVNSSFFFWSLCWPFPTSNETMSFSDWWIFYFTRELYPST